MCRASRATPREEYTDDHTRRFLPESIRAWRLIEGRYRPWLPEADGRWHSRHLALAFDLEDGWATVYGRDGRRILREGEVEAERAHLRAEIAHLRRLLDERGDRS